MPRPAESKSGSSIYQHALALITANSYRKLNAFLLENRRSLNIDERDQAGATFLMQAACHGTPKCAQVLLEFGSLVDHVDKDHNTALHHAYRNRHATVATILIRNGASEGLKNNTGRTAREVFKGDRYKAEMFHWHICQSLGGNRRYRKPSPEDFENGTQESDDHVAVEPPNLLRRKKSVLEMLEHYRPKDQDSTADSGAHGTGETAREGSFQQIKNKARLRHARGVSASARLTVGTKSSANLHTVALQRLKSALGRNGKNIFAVNSKSDLSTNKAQRNAEPQPQSTTDEVAAMQSNAASSGPRPRTSRPRTALAVSPNMHQRQKSDRFQWLRQTDQFSPEPSADESDVLLSEQLSPSSPLSRAISPKRLLSPKFVRPTSPSKSRSPPNTRSPSSHNASHGTRAQTKTPISFPGPITERKLARSKSAIFPRSSQETRFSTRSPDVIPVAENGELSNSNSPPSKLSPTHKVLGGGGFEVKGEFWSPHKSSIQNEGNVSSWLNRFQHEQGLFASSHVFAKMKLDEALHMLDVGGVAPRAMTSLLAFLLSELEPALNSAGDFPVFTAIYTVVSIFHSDSEMLPHQQLVEAGRVMMGIVDKNGNQLGAYLQEIAMCNSEKELVLFLRRRFAEEMALRPKLEEALRKAARMKVLEQKTINRITLRSIFDMRRRVMHKWKAAVLVRHRLNSIGLQLFKKQRGALLRGRIKQWRYAVDHKLLRKSRKRLQEIRNDIKRTTALRDQATKKNREITNTLQEMQDTIMSVSKELEKQQALLRHPARNTRTLGNITLTLSQSVTAFSVITNSLTHFQRTTWCDAERVDRRTMNCFVPANEAPTWDEESEVEMRKFLPGKRGANEWSPAFEPFKRRAGQLLLRWVEYQNSFVQELDPHIYSPPPIIEESEAENGTDQKQLTNDEENIHPIALEDAATQPSAVAHLGDNGRKFDCFEPQTQLPVASSLRSGKAVANLCCVLRSKFLAKPDLPCLKSLHAEEDIITVDLRELTDEEEEDEDFDEITAENEQRQKEEEESRAAEESDREAAGPAASETLLQRKKERLQSARRDAEAAAKIAAAREKILSVERNERLLEKFQADGFLDTGFFAYLTREHLSFHKPKKSRAQRLTERKLRNRLESESTTDIVVQLVSKYFTHRVPVEKTGTQYLYSFLGYLLNAFPGVERDVVILSRSLEALDVQFRDPLTEMGRRLSTFTKGKLPVDHEREELVAIAEELNTTSTILHRPIEQFEALIAENFSDAAAFEKLLDEVVFVAWQSLCIKILSRRFREEIDVDDGTFTTLQYPKLQPVFTELEIDEEPARDAMEKIKVIYKRRIRDLKRIFGYYAASKPGDVGTLDKAEYWKFVKEIKVQADTSKHRIPSSRVDLVFQMYCLLVFKLNEDADKVFCAELEPNDFVHILVYLGCYAFPKKHKATLDERVNTILETYVLPNACSADIDVFRDRFYLDETQDELEAHRFHIFGFYEYYAAADQTGDAALALDSMNMKEFTEFANDSSLVGAGRLSYIAVRTIFAYVQQDMDIMETSFASNAGGDDDDDDANEMVLREFMEALAAIAVWIQPSPLQTVGSRLRSALEDVIIPNAMSKSPIENFMRKYKLPKNS